MIKTKFDYNKYLRKNTLPHIWCPGCGDGIILKALLRAIDKSGYSKDEVVITSGIGCASRLPGYVDFNTIHTTHGRALTFAIGIKMYKPRLKVITISGDGDALAIGGNHFIHAARRNIDMTLIVFNNYTYGMTGGQYSPTQPLDSYSTTTPFGNIEPPFDVCNLAQAAGATWVGRSTSYHAVQLEKFMVDALNHTGFSVLDVITNCHISYGRRNKMKSPVEMIKYQKEKAVPARSAENMTPEDLAGRFKTGILFEKKDMPEFCGEYYKKLETIKIK
ncbi:MAG: 2-oxoacid:ferredoxin oxidoreductase subunit beta [Candidatus Acidulodesulfobacterium ferriphilum]|jgi:2-oxoglutarate ferredoxin oxidoreductase subunit beta|uniref:2-oxoacid:ferredoxin oxidoreductase subunit beta n=1 Tax=Candidatus Acidulodesulfobacterium ferriphilum TaxID=2597223 RepID=A0A519BDQ9_9DELT|nr:MAG: 2-oxoacid:ferredoxin oxidoreductase subunit beta [Candidatus Acidulodesulfobacterium ferriphilum]